MYCRYSGMPLPVYPDFPNLPIKEDAHILMRAPFHLLIDEVEKRKSLTDRQQRLLFIALLKSTDLVIFEVPAIPSERTIETEFNRLLTIAYYIQGHRSFYTHFPRFKVTKKDPAISNLPHVINAWFEVKEKNTWTAKERKELWEQEAFEELGTKVTHALLKRTKLTPTFNKHLIKWALESAHAPAHKQISWAKIFLTKEDKLCRVCVGKKLLLNPLSHALESCPNCDGTGRVSDINKIPFKAIQELRNFMMDSLPEETSYESTRKHAILRHLAIKVQKIKQLHAAFGLNLLSEIPATEEEKSKGKIQLQKEPEKKDFPSAIEYLKALAQFRAAQDLVETEETEEEEIEFDESDRDSLKTSDEDEEDLILPSDEEGDSDE